MKTFLALSLVFAMCSGLSMTPQRSVVSRRQVFSVASSIAVVFTTTSPAIGRPEGVNRPELLPKTKGETVIQVGVNFLTSGQIKRLEKLISELEVKSGWKVRVLCQSYPETPGLAIKDYWGVDDNTIVLVADKGLKGQSNILNFNVGDGFQETLPTIFWTRLQGRFGTTRFYRDKGEDVSILSAVESIVYCAPDGCVDPPTEAMLRPKLGFE
mmetsp:Transcript_9612/g.12066  ORF Transcript_9612/g.12066 Transcript_9612/m.12066 type:complete len:212 (+) Transcript_9612:52-687(+)